MEKYCTEKFLFWMNSRFLDPNYSVRFPLPQPVFQADGIDRYKVRIATCSNHTQFHLL